MDKNVNWSREVKIERTMEALNKNNINAYYAKSREELIDIITKLVSEGSVVTCGGSMTLFETGVMDHLRSGRYKLLDRYADNLTPEEVKDIYRAAFSADAYFTSSNAITEKGELYNVDGNGNRVAAMLFGPDKVIVIAGINKIVPDVEAAMERNRRFSAPINAKRLNKNTPCAKTGYCVDCNSPERICLEYTLIKKQRTKGRLNVIILNEELGY